MLRENTLRKVGRSLFLTVPADLVRTFRLTAGDKVVWEAGDENGTTLKFFRATIIKTPALREEEATVDST
jgi:antitoxin component of MazEF toxin-antitoxin module